jgi:very-short-patch-repair endonuclease
LSSGLSPDALKRFLVDGSWSRILPHTFSLWTPRPAAERWRQLVMAGALWLGKSSAASHRAGAAVWELDGISKAPVELTTASRRRSTTFLIVVHNVTSLRSEDISYRQGLPVTCVPRTLVDLASVERPEILDMAFEDAIRRRLVRVDEIEAAMNRMRPSQPGRKALRLILERYPGVPTDSALETMAWRLFRKAPFPPPVRQYEVRDAAGNFVARADFAFPDAQIAVEADGVEFHSTPRDLAKDRVRDAALSRLGWTMYRLSWDDIVRRGDAVLREITALLAAAERKKTQKGRRAPIFGRVSTR